MEGRELPLIMISRLPAVDIPSSANAASSNDKAAPQQQQQTPSAVDLKKLTQETLLLPNSFLHWMNAVRNRALPPHACNLPYFTEQPPRCFKNRLFDLESKTLFYIKSS